MNRPNTPSCEAGCKCSNSGERKVGIIEQFDHPLFAESLAVVEVDEYFDRPQHLVLIHLLLDQPAELRCRTALAAGKNIVTVSTGNDADITRLGAGAAESAGRDGDLEFCLGLCPAGEFCQDFL